VGGEFSIGVVWHSGLVTEDGEEVDGAGLSRRGDDLLEETNVLEKARGRSAIMMINNHKIVVVYYILY
jgi:hypothetical protein